MTSPRCRWTSVGRLKIILSSYSPITRATTVTSSVSLSLSRHSQLPAFSPSSVAKIHQHHQHRLLHHWPSGILHQQQQKHLSSAARRPTSQSQPNLSAPAAAASSNFTTTTTTTTTNNNRIASNKSPKMAPIPKVMSGVVIPENGDVSVLTYSTTIPVPTLQPGQVLVKNSLIGVNFIDTYFRTGLYKPPGNKFPFITGKEAAGNIAAFHPSVTPDQQRELGLQHDARVAYIGDQTYAEYTAVSADMVVPIPDDISTETAAAALLQGLTALTFVREAGGITQQLGLDLGPWALVHAAAGGTGSNLVQVLVSMGARVIGAAGGPEKCELVKQLGAGWVVDSRSEDIVSQVMEITKGKGVDVIFDGVGKATFDRDFEMIARKGTIAVFGNASGPVEPFNILRLGPKNVKLLRPVLFGYIETREERKEYTAELFRLIRTGKLTVKIHKIYPLKDVAQAHQDLEGRKTTGKLLLQV